MNDNDKKTIRLFYALLPSPEVLAELTDISDRLQKAAQFTSARLSWVKPDGYHITLFFLGELPTAKAERLAAELPDVAGEVEPFIGDFRKLDFFPKEDRLPPKVLWAGVHNPSASFTLLRKSCASSIARAALPVPDQDFSPHITLARLKSTSGLTPFRDMVSNYRDHRFGKCTIDRLVLMESITGDGPARYEPYATAPLKGANL